MAWGRRVQLDDGLPGLPVVQFPWLPSLVTRWQPRQAEQAEAQGPGQVHLGGCINSLGLPQKRTALKTRNLFPHDSGNYRSEVKMSAVLASLEASLLGLQMAFFYLSFPGCVSVFSSLLFMRSLVLLDGGPAHDLRLI